MRVDLNDVVVDHHDARRPRIADKRLNCFDGWVGTVNAEEPRVVYEDCIVGLAFTKCDVKLAKDRCVAFGPSRRVHPGVVAVQPQNSWRRHLS